MKSQIYQQDITKLNLKCQQHQFNESEFVYLKQDASNVFICSRCVTESDGKIQLADCIQLKQIYEANADTILSKYPPLGSPELNQKVLLFSGSIEGEIKHIKEYYQKLIQSYEKAVKNAIEKSKIEVGNLQRLRNSFIKLYGKVSQIENLKQLIIQSQQDNSDTKLRNFINNKVKEADKNAKTIISQLNELQEYKESFSSAQPEKQIINSLEEINKISFFYKETKVNDTPLDIVIPNQTKQKRWKINSITLTVTSQQSQYKVERPENSLILKNTSPNQIHAFFQDILDPKKNYIMILKTIIRDKMQPNPSFFFGVINIDNKSNLLYDEINGEKNISKMIKGKSLHLGSDVDTNLQNYWRWNGERRFEVRFNQENRILKVGSLPGYSLVAEIKQRTEIDLFSQYTFIVGCSGRGNMIVMEDVLEVDSFDDSMDIQRNIFQKCYSGIFKKKANFKL